MMGVRFPVFAEFKAYATIKVYVLCVYVWQVQCCEVPLVCLCYNARVLLFPSPSHLLMSGHNWADCSPTGKVLATLGRVGATIKIPFLGGGDAPRPL